MMKELVAVAAQISALNRTIDELRVRVERGLENQKIRIATLATILDASELVARLVRMEIVVEGEGEE